MSGDLLPPFALFIGLPPPPSAPPPPPLRRAAPRSLGDISHLEAAGLRIPDSKYEKPNVYGAHARPSGIKANFR